MPLKTSEIRWFSNSKKELWKIFSNLEEKGAGAAEGERSDYYLKSSTPSAGIKIREGNHEMKVKTAEDEPVNSGLIQHWSKWSYQEEQNILNSALLQDWIEVRKTRFKKNYVVIAGEVKFTSAEDIKEKCEVEFTKIEIPAIDYAGFTLGLEASGSNEKENLKTALQGISLDEEILKKLESCSYPEFLANLLSG
ncbi:hypothetical protein RM553_03940 [Zunongwangia sp. F363]|uniref:CYTH domain-containing protein n=1 Tax=Autumnicola tepida TaxID=3075595 RepID=A0ABU3C6J5_9FLAO|nr:hypothetical protein [Zunongwangia sp. F363]MDT0641975.1 hypothetical protein [Zunongwangia sp. F363]